MILAFVVLLLIGTVAAAASLTWLVILTALMMLALVVLEGRADYRRHLGERAKHRQRLRESAWRATEHYR